ncbi:carboxypeptidase-like regulatory domain-containing protein [Parafilimonas sp.]|uniref:carboxypeptidase-like regulatory domain-containing protein n=1 Tax=Parafilimonas sp. TaxID=1969739 RepID=UPI003F7ED766
MKFFILGIALFICALPAHAQKDSTVIFKVSGACDAFCKPRIEAAAQGRGVQAATWSAQTGMLTLRYDPSKTSIQKVQQRILDVGHDLEDKKADDAVYNALPKCCRYRHDNMQALHHGDTSASIPNNITPPTIKGVVMEEDNKGVFKPLAGASVTWLNTGSGTTTDENGIFSLLQTGERLVVSYTGYEADTITVIPTGELKIILANNRQLKEVKVTTSGASNFIRDNDVVRTNVITQKELFKAACCNLSESFETNPAVDVAYSDAVTGSKQIQLLGLAGIYTQLTVENLPGPRGLAIAQGLNYIPGTWIESLQLSKGMGSVANGFESIAGQINVELKKPTSAEKLFANAYVNSFGKTDLNLNLSHKINDKWSTALLLHDDFLANKSIDMNDDGFRDLPAGNLFTIENRWSFDNAKGITSQFGIKYLNDDKTGGQVNYNASTDKFTTNNYGLGINTKRIEGFGKLGYVFPQKKYKSMGLQLSAFDHQQNSYFGFTTYNAHQQNFYSNLIYQSIINTTIHKFRTGLSFLYDKYDETLDSAAYKRTEVVPGAFIEYTWSPVTNFDVVAGLREDHNSLYGWFTTPHLNIRYAPFKSTTIRISGGRGQRTANIFAENNGVLASARTVAIISSYTKGAYGLKPEISWNKGISIDQKFRLFNRSATAAVDFYRNDFSNQVIVDLENARVIKFYNLQGKSYSNSFQAEVSFMPLRRLDVRLAYRLFDVKTTFDSVLLQKPFTAKNRAFANFEYGISGWRFDYTLSYNSRKRLPSTQANPEQYQRPDYAPAYVIMNAQVTKSFGKEKIVDVYLGAENLTNFYQKNAIIAADEPFSKYFDASLVWGPLTGRMFYGGLRFRIK